MMISPNRPPRPRLTARILVYALADVFGLACVAIGASWFATGQGGLLPDFPTSAVEAVASTAGGVAVMFWSVTRILREIARQGPEMQAKYDAYIAARHPEHRPPAGD